MFEQSKCEVILATQSLTEAQQAYNQSLSIPTELVCKVNLLLDRIKTFEDNLNQLGEELKQSDIIGNEQLNLIRSQLMVLKEKNAVASNYADTTTTELITFFTSQKESLKGKTNEWNQTLMNYGDEYARIVNEMQTQMKNRWNEFIRQMDKLFDTSEVTTPLNYLKQLQPIYEGIKAIESRLADNQTIEKKLDDISTEVANINEAVNSIPATPIQLSSSSELNAPTGNTSSIQQSIQGMEKRMDIVFQINQRLDIILQNIERIKLPQSTPISSISDNMKYQQELTEARNKISQLQEELNAIRQDPGMADYTSVIEDLKNQLKEKEEELRKQLEGPWYKRIFRR